MRPRTKEGRNERSHIEKGRKRLGGQRTSRGERAEKEVEVRAREPRTRTPRRGNLDPRHTTNPPVPCLSRPLALRKVGNVHGVARTAPPGGRLWHGFAVRRPPVRRGGRGLTFGLSRPNFGRSQIDPVHFGVPLDKRGMQRKSSPPTFFTERSPAAFLAVSDRTIRNWIRRGDLPSYKLGASRRIDPADVEDFLARHRDEAA